MKRIGVLFLMILLLCGCGQKSPAQAASLSLASSQSRQTPDAAGGRPQARTRGALQVYPLESTKVCAVFAMGEDLLIIRQEENAAVFIRLDGQSLTLKARAELPVRISEGAEEIQVYPHSIHCYDEDSSQIFLLNGDLETTGAVQVPQGARGRPWLSENGTLFYCTDSEIRCLDMESGISRVLKEDSSPEKLLLGLALEDRVLQLRWEDPLLGSVSRFLSAENGQTLWEGSESVTLTSSGSRYYAALSCGDRTDLIFGQGDAQPRMLLPEESGCQSVFLPEIHGAVLVEPFVDTGEVRLDFCPLEEGSITDSITFSTRSYPRFFTGIGETVYFLLYDDTLHCDVLCRWAPEKQAAVEAAIITYPYYSAAAPDEAGLARCAELARQLGEHYGVDVLIGKEAAAAHPWDYDFAPEHQVPLILRQLRLLQQRLDRYPAGFLQTLAQCAEGLTVCLVRTITGSAESGGMEAADAILFWQGNHAFLALSAGEGNEGALYHALCHLIDTRVYSHSNAYDSWENLNPGDFQYDYDYAANRQRQSHQFLQNHSRSFVDMYSMSFPREDRARIMEYAMLPGNDALFQAPILQQKLLTLCTGIREAFQLEDYPQALPWEQYLNTPLFPTPEG